MYSELKNKIIPLVPTRVWRTYLGGKELERWQGASDPEDGELPEEWIASVVEARNPGREELLEGLSKIKILGFEGLTLKDLIESAPIDFLGKPHFDKFGTNLGVLAKLIDSLSRLTIQVHPDKIFAKNILKSDYGKTECWYILGGRKVGGEKPYVLLGFKPGITKEHWRTLFEEQNIQAMLDCLNKIYVKPGEIYFIDGGVPHAIGSGCFLVEIQEPTDYTMRVERVTPEGNLIPDFLCHQGVGFDNLYNCFHYEGLTMEETLKRWKIQPKKVYEKNGAEKWEIVGKDTTTLFSMDRLLINKKYEEKSCETFYSVTVIAGEGKISFCNESLQIRQGDFLFIPALLGTINFEAVGEISLELIRCYPPTVSNRNREGCI